MSKTATLLDELVKTSENGQKGFQEAAELAKDPNLKTTLSHFADDCERAAAELQEVIRALGDTPPDRGTLAGAVHRGFVKAKAALEGDDAAILEEVERGEDHAKKAYAKVLESIGSDADSSIRSLVAQQHAGVIRHHDQIRSLRNQYRAQNR
jgi:uncharacterized protein (TIGR02284 family)